MNEAVNMAALCVPKSDQLNADDLIGGPRTITIRAVKANPGAREQPVSVYFEGDNDKPFKPCLSMRRVMVAAWGPDAHAYIGRSMSLYCDPKVAFGGMQVGGIRISHMSHIERDLTLALTVTKAKRAPFQVKRLVDAPASEPADHASGWAASYIASVNEAEDVAALDDYVAKKAKKLAELKTARPELHLRCEAAVLARRQSFVSPADTESANTDQDFA